MIERIFTTIDEAEKAHRAAASANSSMSAVLTEVMRKLIHPGQTIDLTYDQSKDWDLWLINVKTMRGNDRGSKVFRIESEVTVEANPHAFELSRWSCEASPISSTGKVLSGRSHGADGNRSTVKIVGSIIPMAPMTLEGEAYKKWNVDRLTEVIEKSVRCA